MCYGEVPVNTYAAYVLLLGVNALWTLDLGPRRRASELGPEKKACQAALHCKCCLCAGSFDVMLHGVLAAMEAPQCSAAIRSLRREQELI